MSSLAEKLATLANPEPVFHDPEEDDNDVTAAKVVNMEDLEAGEDLGDSAYLKPETPSGKSVLRSRNASLLSDDSRYKGKKSSRAAIAKERGQEDNDQADLREHSSAELGHMFGFVDDDDDDDDEEEDGNDEDLDDDEDDDNEEEEAESDGDEDEDNSSDDALSSQKLKKLSLSKTTKSMEKISKNKSASQKQKGQEFTFDVSDGDFSKFGDDGDFEESDDEPSDEDEVEMGEEDDENSGSEDSAADNDDAAESSDRGQAVFGEDKGSLEADLARGRAVEAQVSHWDKLMEVRIQEQKILAKINRFPVGKALKNCSSDDNPELQTAVKDCQKSLKLLLHDLVDLESQMRKRLADPSDDVEPEPPKKMKLSQVGEQLGEAHRDHLQVRDDLIQKWSDKTRITAGQVGKGFSSLETSTLTQIQQIMSNRPRLVARTQVKRSNYRILGESSSGEVALAQETNPNIFDDDDFYHQMLRELIDRKTANDADQSQLSRQWLEVQKLRSKLKKKVDTKASKGRKIRYDIHSKLVNFMAPVYRRGGSEDTLNMLFSSLFGGKAAG